MYVLIAQSGFDWTEDPKYRVLAIFKDNLIAIREKRKIEKAIKDAENKGEKDGQDKFMDCNKNHPYWRYVRQLDPEYDPCPDETTYHIQQARVMTVL